MEGFQVGEGKFSLLNLFWFSDLPGPCLGVQIEQGDEVSSDDEVGSKMGIDNIIDFPEVNKGGNLFHVPGESLQEHCLQAKTSGCSVGCASESDLLCHPLAKKKTKNKRLRRRNQKAMIDRERGLPICEPFVSGHVLSMNPLDILPSRHGDSVGENNLDGVKFVNGDNKIHEIGGFDCFCSDYFSLEACSRVLHGCGVWTEWGSLIPTDEAFEWCYVRGVSSRRKTKNKLLRKKMELKMKRTVPISNQFEALEEEEEEEEGESDSEVFFESEDAGEDYTSCTEELADEILESLLEPTWIDDGPTYYAQEANFWMNLDEAAALADSNDEDIAICPDPWRFLPMFSEFEDVQTACFEADEAEAFHGSEVSGWTETLLGQKAIESMKGCEMQHMAVDAIPCSTGVFVPLSTDCICPCKLAPEFTSSTEHVGDDCDDNLKDLCTSVSEILPSINNTVASLAIDDHSLECSVTDAEEDEIIECFISCLRRDESHDEAPNLSVRDFEPVAPMPPRRKER
jgi:hypothetical protein